MTRLGSFEQLQELLRRYPRRLSNNYLLPDAAGKLIRLGALSYAAEENGIFLFERREGYVKLFFQLKSHDAELPVTLEPLVSYVVYRDPEKSAEIGGWLIRQGFAVGSERVHLAAERLETAPSLEGIDRASTEEALALFDECFAPFCADLPPPELCGELLAVRSKTNEAMGIIHTGNPICIAVRKNARRQGVASRLFSAYAAVQTGSCKLWTDSDNDAALSFYHKLGFKADGLKAMRYIRE